MTRIAMWPVVAANHPLAALPQPLAREALEPHVQLVLTDRTPLTQNLSGGILSRHIWRFADLATRLDFLLAGFGWCNMPSHMVSEHVAAGRLKRLTIANQEEDRAAALRRARARPPAGPSRTMADRGLARADEDLPGRPSSQRRRASGGRSRRCLRQVAARCRTGAIRRRHGFAERSSAASTAFASSISHSWYR